MVVDGILTYISGASTISGEPKRTVYTEGFGGIIHEHQQGRDLQRGMTNRQIVQIGDTRLTNVVLPRLADAMLVEAMGKEVAVAVNGPDRAKRMTVVSMRTPDHGLYKPPLGRLLLAMAFMGTWMLFLAGAGAIAIAIVIGAIVSPAIGGVAALAFMYWLLVPTIRAWRAGLEARSALG